MVNHKPADCLMFTSTLHCSILDGVRGNYIRNPGMDLFIGLLVFCLVTSLFPLYFYRGVLPHQEMVRKRNSGENATNPGMDLLYFLIGCLLDKQNQVSPISQFSPNNLT